MAAVVITAAIAYRYAAVSSGQERSPLTASNETLQIGPVEPSPDYRHVLRIRNASKRTIQVDEFVSSCSCADVSPKRLTIAAGEESTVVLTVDLTRYIKPGDDSIIPGTLHVAPVVAGRRLNAWEIALQVKRPRMITWPAGAINLGNVYQDQSSVTSQHTLYAMNAIRAGSLSAETTSPHVRSAVLEQHKGVARYYRRYSITFALPEPSERRRCIGPHEFTLTIRSPGEELEVPCVVSFDSGLRIHVDQRPSTIVRVGEPVRWTARVYCVGKDLTSLDAALEHPAEHSGRISKKDRLEDGVWTVECELTPGTTGNIPCALRISASDAGEQLIRTEPFNFYVPKSGGK